jgi:hypothetical protein
MGLEDLTGASKFIDDLVNTNPASGDSPSQGDDHIRGVKNVLVNSFPSITGAVTSTHTELNILDGVTSTTAELNILDGVTSTAAELNILDGVTSTTAEINLLDGVTATTGEINYIDVATKGTAEASKALVVDASKNISGINSLGCGPLTLTNTSDGADAGPVLTLDRNSASPAVGDILGIISFSGRDSATNTDNYARIFPQIVDPTTTSEDGRLNFQTIIAGSMATRMYVEHGMVVGSPTGLDKGSGTINCAGDVYKNNSAYTNPDYVFEHAYNGSIVEFKDNPGAETYEGIKSIDEIERHTKEELRLPGFTDNPMGAFERSDLLLEKLEEAYLLIFELNRRLKAAGL